MKKNKDIINFSIYDKIENPIEVKLLIHCLNQFLYKESLDQIKSIVATETINWDEFIKYSRDQSVILPVAHVLIFNRISNIPQDKINQLLKVQQFYRKRNQNLIKESNRVQSALDKHGLKGIPYKGLVLSKQFYNTVIHRTSVDIDFAMDLADFSKVKAVMTELGYEEYKSNINMDAIEQSRAFYLDYPFVLKVQDKIVCSVEFHWTPSHQILNIPITFKEFMNSTEQINIGKNQFVTFDKVSQALFAIIHHGNVDCWGKMKHFVDFAFILKQLSSEETEQLQKLCKKYHVYNSYEIGKALLHTLFNTELSFKKQPSKKWVEDILNGTLKGNWSENKRKFIYFLQSRDSFWEKIKSTFSIVKYQFFIKPKLDLIEEES